MANMTENSKLFLILARHMGISQPRKSHRGIIAKRSLSKLGLSNFGLSKLEKSELAEFGKTLNRIKFNPSIPLFEAGKLVGHIQN